MRWGIVVVSIALWACSDSGPGGDPCGFSSDDYLPYAAGNTWSYRVTEIDSGDVSDKSQTIEPVMTHADYGDVFTQVTTKSTGRTESFIGVSGDALLRYEQTDYDELGVKERRTTYEPSKLRIDESAARLALGATWDDTYARAEYDETDTLVDTIMRTDRWEVMALDTSCESPLGTFSCVQLRRTTTAGGVAQKDFFFAAGIGKVKEIGAQVEELVSCETPE